MTQKSSARTLTSKDLIVDHFTLARHHPLEDRFRVIAEAGAEGVGLYLGDVQRALDAGMDLDHLGELLDHHGLVLADLEAVRAFSDDPGVTAATEAFLALAWELADRFGARYLQVVGPTGTSPQIAAERFGALCDRAAGRGLLVGIEPLPFTDLRTATEVMDIVRLADRVNGGICLDIWHHTRSGEGREALLAIDPAKVFAVQMSDGPLSPTIDDYREDCLRTRVAPGAGEMDALGFVRDVVALGVDCPWSLEVCNEAVWDDDEAAARHVHDSVHALRELVALATAPD